MNNRECQSALSAFGRRRCHVVSQVGSHVVNGWRSTCSWRATWAHIRYCHSHGSNVAISTAKPACSCCPRPAARNGLLRPRHPEHFVRSLLQQVWSRFTADRPGSPSWVNHHYPPFAPKCTSSLNRDKTRKKKQTRPGEPTEPSVRRRACCSLVTLKDPQTVVKRLSSTTKTLPCSLMRYHLSIT